MTLSYRSLQLGSIPLLFFILFCSPLLSLFLFGIILTLLFIDCDISTKLLEIFGTKPESSDLRNCVVWITGASSGIGEQLAYELSRCGASLVLTARNKEQLERVADKCREFKCAECMVLPLDITKIDKHQSSLNSILEQLGRVDILVNNAGRTQRSPFLSCDLQVDRDLFEIDYFAQVSLTRVVANQMVESGLKGGQIVFVTSVAKYGAPFQSAYCGAKAALHGAFESVRVELNSAGINVLFAVPGPVESQISENAFTSIPGQERVDLSWSKAMVFLTLDEFCCLLTAYQKFKGEARDAYLDLLRTPESVEEEEFDEPVKKRKSGTTKVDS